MSHGLVAFVLLHYAFAGSLALLAFLIGARLTRRVAYHSAAEKLCFCTGLGLGVVASAVFLLGLLHLLTPTAVLGALAVASVLLWPTARDLQADAVRAWRSLSWRRLAACAAILVVLSPVLLLPLYPPVHWDATAYHLAVARIHASAHAVVPTPYLRFPVFPQLNEMLFALALLLYDDLAAHLVQFLMMGTTAAAICAWGRRAFGAAAGLWGAALWLSNPLVLWLGACGYIDLGLAAFLTLALYALFNWVSSRSAPWLLLCAAFLGFSAGVKYLALFPALGVGLLLAHRCARQGRVRDLVAFVALFLAIAGPWYLRNAVHTGNPVWPYWGSQLGYGPWTQEDTRDQLRHQFHPGAGRGPVALLLLPWNLAFHGPTSFLAEYPLSPVYPFLLPLCLGAAIRDSRLRALLAVTGLYTLVWFATAQQMRYLLHALPLLSLAAGAALGAFASRLRRVQSPALVGVVCVLVAVPGALRASVPGRFGSPLVPDALPPVRAEERAAFIQRFNPIHSAVELLNRRRGDDYTLYSLAYSNMAYFADGGFVGDWYGPARHGDLLKHLADPEALYQELRRLGVDHFLANQTGGFADFADALLSPGLLAGHLKLIHAGSALLFEVVDRPVQLEGARELLGNGGLEERSAGGPAGWEASGSPVLDGTGAHSYAGATAVLLDDRSWLEQSVPVEGGAHYVLRGFARAAGPGQSSRLRIHWLDAGGAVIGSSLRVVPETTGWSPRALAGSAPAAASRAELAVGADGGSEVWFDELSFARIGYR
jgi:4-amino-4-deoxy-L-arabinose transferase-like glycosyltransferase